MDGSQKVCSAEKFTAVGNWGSSCWKTLEDFIEPALEFPTLGEKEEVFILQLQSVICWRLLPETPQAEYRRIIVDATGMYWSGECPGTMDRAQKG